MRHLFLSFTFLLSLILGAVAFAATVIEQPTLMREFLSWARHVPDYFNTIGMSDKYAVWVDILLGGDKLVFMGYLIVARLVVGLTFAGFGRLFDRARGAGSAKSVFLGWG